MKVTEFFNVQVWILRLCCITLFLATGTTLLGQSTEQTNTKRDREDSTKMLINPVEALLPGLYFLGDSLDVKKVVAIINSTLPEKHSVVAQQVEGRSGYFLVRLLASAGQLQMGGREDLALCIFHTLTKTDQPYYVKVVNHSSLVLIGNARMGTIDIADIEKFNQFRFNNEVKSLQYNSVNILVHELYEQYHLQVLSGANPAAAKAKQIRKAHRFATQKESNYFNMGYTKTISEMYAGYMLVEFVMKDNSSSRIKFRIDHKYGNVVFVKSL